MRAPRTSFFVPHIVGHPLSLLNIRYPSLNIHPALPPLEVRQRSSVLLNAVSAGQVLADSITPRRFNLFLLAVFVTTQLGLLWSPAAWTCSRNHSSTSSSSRIVMRLLPAVSSGRRRVSRRRSHTLASSLALVLTPFPGRHLSRRYQTRPIAAPWVHDHDHASQNIYPIVTYRSSADLACAGRIASEHVAEALQVRGE